MYIFSIIEYLRKILAICNPQKSILRDQNGKENLSVSLSAFTVNFRVEGIESNFSNSNFI